MMPQTQFRAAAVALVAALLLIACGQRGPLTLPDTAAAAGTPSAAPAPAAAVSAPASASASTAH